MDDNPSLAAYLNCEFNDEVNQVKLNQVFGLENMVGKFFLETDLDWIVRNTELPIVFHMAIMNTSRPTNDLVDIYIYNRHNICLC